MNYKVYKKEELQARRWTGGKTTQLGIFPTESRYEERQFTWRLSTATCDLEESNFTALPDYHRVLMVLKGKARLLYDGEKAVELSELEQDSFDGALETVSIGKITDYNLMVRKGNLGYLEVKEAMDNKVSLTFERRQGYNNISRGIYCIEGELTVLIGGETICLEEENQLVVTYGSDENINIDIIGKGKAIISNIFFN